MKKALGWKIYTGIYIDIYLCIYDSQKLSCLSREIVIIIGMKGVSLIVFIIGWPLGV